MVTNLKRLVLLAMTVSLTTLAGAQDSDVREDADTSHATTAQRKGDKMTWQGNWNNRKFGTKGPLTCTASVKDAKTWQATFEGKGLGKPFKYNVTITATKKGAQTVLRGTSTISGDRYQWAGNVKGQTLYGRYRSAKGNNGEFVLKKVVEAVGGHAAEIAR